MLRYTKKKLLLQIRICGNREMLVWQLSMGNCGKVVVHNYINAVGVMK